MYKRIIEAIAVVKVVRIEGLRIINELGLIEEIKNVCE